MLKFWLSSSCPKVSEMVPVTLKLIVSPEAAAAMTDRSVPAEPSSAKLVTVSVAAKLGKATPRDSRPTASACSAKHLKGPAILDRRAHPRISEESKSAQVGNSREFMSADRERGKAMIQ